MPKPIQRSISSGFSLAALHMEDESEDPFFDRHKVDEFLEEPKRLKKKALKLQAGSKAVHIPVESKVVPDAALTVRILPDGDIRLGVGLPSSPSVTFCRYDRVPHVRPHICAETGKPIEAGHKHYYGRNVKGEQRIVNRGPKHIPVSSPSSAIKAFCKEVGIRPPERIKVIFSAGLGDYA
jgi:hypothetical protein